MTYYEADLQSRPTLLKAVESMDNVVREWSSGSVTLSWMYAKDVNPDPILADYELGLAVAKRYRELLTENSVEDA